MDPILDAAVQYPRSAEPDNCWLSSTLPPVWTQMWVELCQDEYLFFLKDQYLSYRDKNLVLPFALDIYQIATKS
ncbi:hypothetical protein TNCV_2104081 [Trichonephila clavipes]|nr:hypothetical protein TNCV_2104081 [Trichonephila clavipes]